MGSSYQECVWWRLMAPTAAWCWLKRGVKTCKAPNQEERAKQVEQAHQEQIAEIPEEKNKVELSVAPDLLAQIPLEGNVITGDALYAQRELCAQIIEGKGDYLFTVKANQPELLQAIEYLFQEPPFGEKFTFARQCDAHAERIDTRRLWASPA